MTQPKFRSNFERDFAKQLTAAGIDYTFETDKLQYVVKRNYIPDFSLAPNFFVETKGRFVSQDRAKQLQVKKDNPNAVIILVFMNPNITLTKASKTTYWQWADKNGILWTTQDKAIKFIEYQLSKHLAYTGTKQPRKR